MTGNLVVSVAFVINSGFAWQSVAEHMMATIPKITKIKKPKKERSEEKLTMTNCDQPKDNQTTDSKPVAMNDKCSGSRLRGGGKYGASYAKFAGSERAGCPALN